MAEVVPAVTNIIWIPLPWQQAAVSQNLILNLHLITCLHSSGSSLVGSGLGLGVCRQELVNQLLHHDLGIPETAGKLFSAPKLQRTGCNVKEPAMVHACLQVYSVRTCSMAVILKVQKPLPSSM